jgi:hypothetical protein
MADKHEVRIHIDQKPYHAPNPTIGEALYALGNVKPGLELYREVQGNREDKPIPRDKEHVHLKEDDHFHSGKPHKFTIIVNARKKKVTDDELTFEQIVALAFDPVPPNSFFTVTFSGGVHHQEGSLQPGQKVKIKDGMEFNVTETGQS